MNFMSGHFERAAEKPRMVVTLPGVDRILIDVDSDDKERQCGPADVESFSLTDREIVRAVVVSFELAHIGRKRKWCRMKFKRFTACRIKRRAIEYFVSSVYFENLTGFRF